MSYNSTFTHSTAVGELLLDLHTPGWPLKRVLTMADNHHRQTSVISIHPRSGMRKEAHILHGGNLSTHGPTTTVTFPHTLCHTLHTPHHIFSFPSRTSTYMRVGRCCGTCVPLLACASAAGRLSGACPGSASTAVLHWWETPCCLAISPLSRCKSFKVLGFEGFIFFCVCQWCIEKLSSKGADWCGFECSVELRRTSCAHASPSADSAWSCAQGKLQHRGSLRQTERSHQLVQLHHSPSAVISVRVSEETHATHIGFDLLLVELQELSVATRNLIDHLSRSQ